MGEDDHGRLVAAAEAVLSERWGAPVRLDDGEALRDRYRNRVRRCPVSAAPGGSPSSVILKASVAEGEADTDAQSDQRGTPGWRFRNEAAGTALLNAVDTAPPLAARLYAADPAAGLIVLEDLGSGESLADRLQGEDPRRLEAGLFAYARSLGRMHAATVGREPEFARLRAGFGGTDRSVEREGARWLREEVPAFRAGCESLGVALGPGFEAEAAEVASTLDHPGPFLAFAPGDTCPDNHRFVSEDALAFFDFEFGGFRHALLDAAYLRVPFPTCWCVSRLPPGLVPRLEAAYREELARGCPAAMDDARFFPALAHACAYWVVASVSWSLERALKEDEPWGLSTHRQRPPLRLDNLAETAEQWGVLPSLAATARGLSAKLRALWGEEAEMPLYPPFRPPAAS